uniref:Uncharacterized protein n=1 Tax=Parastrongyloides trichosuri TaxID=131310 RepID=A0A0N5A249_PARTI
MIRSVDRSELKITQKTNIKAMNGIVGKNEKLYGRSERGSLKRSKSQGTSPLIKVNCTPPVSTTNQIVQTNFYTTCSTQTELEMLPSEYTEEEKIEDMFAEEVSVKYLINQINCLEQSYCSLIEESFSLDITIDELNESINNVRGEIEAAADIFKDAVQNDDDESEADQE